MAFSILYKNQVKMNQNFKAVMDKLGIEADFVEFDVPKMDMDIEEERE